MATGPAVAARTVRHIMPRPVQAAGVRLRLLQTSAAAAAGSGAAGTASGDAITTVRSDCWTRIRSWNMRIRRSMLLFNHASSVGNSPARRFLSSMIPASHSKFSRYVGPSTSARSLRVNGASVVHHTAQSPPLPFQSNSGSMWPARTKPPIFSQKAPIETASPSGMRVGSTPLRSARRISRRTWLYSSSRHSRSNAPSCPMASWLDWSRSCRYSADQGAGNDDELEHRPEPLGAGSDERSRPVEELHRSTLRPAATMGRLWVRQTRRTRANDRRPAPSSEAMSFSPVVR